MSSSSIGVNATQRPTVARGGFKDLALNVVLYKAGWLACVLGAAQGLGGLGAAVGLALAGVHLVLTKRPDREWPVLVFAAGLGFGLDTLHASFGVLQFGVDAARAVGAPVDLSAAQLAPIWIVALWVQFATLLHYGMSWLSRRYALAAVFGGLGGPLAFLAGEKLGAASFGAPRGLSLSILSISWAVAMPLLVAVADRTRAGAGEYRGMTPGAR